MDDLSRYVARPPRGFELLVGIVALILGAPVFVAGMLLGATVVRGHRETFQVAFATATLGVGLLLLAAGFRLLARKRRADGGLLSPWVLRLGGFIFFSGPFAMLANGHAVMAIVKASACVGAGIACFVIARRREIATECGAEDAAE